MLERLRSISRGLRLLRYPLLVRRLGDLLAEEQELEELRQRFPAARLSSGVIVEGWREGGLQLAPGSVIERGTILSLGDAHNGYGSLAVGERTWVGQYNNLRLAGGTTEIGAGCLISQFCTIVAANHQLSRRMLITDAPARSERHGVLIGDDVWLGAGCIVLPGSRIGRGAVVGAGGVVTGEIGEYEIWAGNPARKIGERPE